MKDFFSLNFQRITSTVISMRCQVIVKYHLKLDNRIESVHPLKKWMNECMMKCDFDFGFQQWLNARNIDGKERIVSNLNFGIFLSTVRTQILHKQRYPWKSGEIYCCLKNECYKLLKDVTTAQRAVYNEKD